MAPGSRILTQLQEAADQMRTVASEDALAKSAVGSSEVWAASPAPRTCRVFAPCHLPNMTHVRGLTAHDWELKQVLAPGKAARLQFKVYLWQCLCDLLPDLIETDP